MDAKHLCALALPAREEPYTAHEIRSAYRQFVLAHHPDKTGQNDNAAVGARLAAAAQARDFLLHLDATDPDANERRSRAADDAADVTAEIAREGFFSDVGEGAHPVKICHTWPKSLEKDAATRKLILNDVPLVADGRRMPRVFLAFPGGAFEVCGSEAPPPVPPGGVVAARAGKMHKDVVEVRLAGCVVWHATCKWRWEKSRSWRLVALTLTSRDPPPEAHAFWEHEQREAAKRVQAQAAAGVKLAEEEAAVCDASAALLREMAAVPVPDNVDDDDDHLPAEFLEVLAAQLDRTADAERSKAARSRSVYAERGAAAETQEGGGKDPAEIREAARRRVDARLTAEAGMATQMWRIHTGINKGDGAPMGFHEFVRVMWMSRYKMMDM